jgi:hypothetical protein
VSGEEGFPRYPTLDPRSFWISLRRKITEDLCKDDPSLHLTLYQM